MAVSCLSILNSHESLAAGQILVKLSHNGYLSSSKLCSRSSHVYDFMGSNLWIVMDCEQNDFLFLNTKLFY